MSDYITFVNDAAILLLNELPLQSYDSAVTLISAYISNVGGWTPNDPSQPNGDGHPANNTTEQQAADAVAGQQFDTVYDLEFDVTAVIRVQLTTNLNAGLDLATAAASMANQVTTFVTDRINQSTAPLRIQSVTSQATVDDHCNLSGETTAALRVLINSDIAGTDKLIEYKALTLLYARDTYGLDDTWNVQSIFTLPSAPIAVLIRKYTDTTYVTLDSQVTQIYVFNISPVTYAVVTGTIIA